jgi:cytochrome c1
LRNDDDGLEHWLREPQRVKPGALMPGFSALGDDRLRALSAYLTELR